VSGIAANLAGAPAVWAGPPTALARWAGPPDASAG
jgi:hypothetical protein